MRYYMIVFVLTFSSIMNASVIKVVGPQSKEDISQAYYYQLLQQALNMSDLKDKQLSTPFKNLTHGRSLQLLSDKKIDVYWAGTTKEREVSFKAIKIPLFKGLLGYRTFIINKEKAYLFDAITESKLKKLLACQGEHWPDTNILRHNGYEVMPVARFDLMFKMLNAGRCDYFPRAIFEGFGELQIAQQEMPNLTMLEPVLIHYPFPIYYFVHKNNIKLADRIESGLLKMIDSGEFDQFMRKHPLTQHLFPSNQWHKKTIFELTNPLLPSNTNIDNKKLWLNLKSSPNTNIN